MSGKRYDIEQLKTDYIGKTFEYFTVIDAIRNENNTACFVCRCKCGNVKTIDVKRIFNGSVKSCGCKPSYKHDADKLKEQYIGATSHFLTVTDVYRNEQDKRIHLICKCRCGNQTDVTLKLFNSGKAYSCGCYKSSEEYKSNTSAAQIKYHKEHPEAATKMSELKKQYYKDHPEKVKELAEHNRQLYINEPNRKKEVGNIISNWFKNNPDEVTKWSNSRRQYYKDHPELGEARSKLYKDHPEICNKISEGNKKYNQEHPEKVKRINDLNRLDRFIKRQQFNYDYIKEYVHPDDLSFLTSGIAKADSLIRTRCPNCGEYAYHNRNHLVSMELGGFKLGKPPLCKVCHVKLTSCFSSKYEDEIAEFVSSFYTGELLRNDRNILDGKELDLYYPKEKIAIEFNGDYWHDENHKPKSYHLNKYLQCKEKGILLVSIFESEWLSKKREIQTYLVNLFNHIDDDLSFISDKSKMNNNYPAPSSISKQFKIEESFYAVNDTKIDMCGYSILEN